jgi:hypothetical protein
MGNFFVQGTELRTSKHTITSATEMGRSLKNTNMGKLNWELVPFNGLCPELINANC